MKKIIAVLVAAFMALVMAAGPAFAAWQYAWHGADRAFVDDTKPRVVGVEDRECDSNPVRVQYYTIYHGQLYGPFYHEDADGCDGNAYYEVNSNIIERFRVGEKTNDGVWHYGSWKETSLPV